jgi:hypothetical protein
LDNLACHPTTGLQRGDWEIELPHAPTLGEKAIELCTDAISWADRALQPGHIGLADFFAKKA